MRAAESLWGVKNKPAELGSAFPDLCMSEEQYVQLQYNFPLMAVALLKARKGSLRSSRLSSQLGGFFKYDFKRQAVQVVVAVFLV